MAKATKETTNNKSACELYVVERLKQAEEENKELKNINSSIMKQYVKLYDLVMNALATAELDTNNSDTFDHLKLLGQYVCSLYKDMEKNTIQEQAFVELINFVKRQVRREE